MIRLNNEQLQIVNAPIQNHIKVIACAGSGKTTTLIYRIKYLIEHDIDEKNIVYVTFTVDASKNMKHRLEKLGIIDVKVCTLDSFALETITKYNFINSQHLMFYHISEYISEFNLFLDETKNEFTFQLEEFKKSLKYFLIDEFQDINYDQFQVIHKISKFAFITAVGDDCQNIYSFRDSNIEYILNLDKYLNNLLTYTLTINYRSTSSIIDFANNCIQFNKHQIKKEMIPFLQNNNDKLKPIVWKTNNIDESVSLVCRTIKLLIQSHNLKLNDFAIITRNNRLLYLIETYMIMNYKYINYILLDNNLDKSGNNKIEQLTLTTIHKSKGLEWECVYLLGCDDYCFPYICNNENELEEERRLFYVAITRARKMLIMNYTSDEITRFINEIPSDYYKCNNFTNVIHSYIYKNPIDNNHSSPNNNKYVDFAKYLRKEFVDKLVWDSIQINQFNIVDFYEYFYFFLLLRIICSKYTLPKKLNIHDYIDNYKKDLLYNYLEFIKHSIDNFYNLNISTKNILYDIYYVSLGTYLKKKRIAKFYQIPNYKILLATLEHVLNVVKLIKIEQVIEINEENKIIHFLNHSIILSTSEYPTTIETLWLMKNPTNIIINIRLSKLFIINSNTSIHYKK